MTDEQILAGLIINDRRTWTYIVREFAPPVLAFVRQNSGSEQDGEDLFQETCIKVKLNIEKGDYKHKGKFAAYFLSIARNTWISELRRRGTRLKHEERAALKDFVKPDDFDEVDYDMLFKSPDLFIFHKVWESWENTECRELLDKKYVKELSYKEIAKEEGLIDEEKIAKAVKNGSTVEAQMKTIEGNIRQQVKRCKAKFMTIFKKEVRKIKP